MPPVLRSILAVIAGFLTMNFIVILLTLLSIATLHLNSGHPTPGYLAFNVVYSFLAALGAGFVTAFAAGRQPLHHAAALAALLLAFGIFSYHHYRGQQPLWYQLMMIATPPLLVLAGAAIFARQSPAAPSQARLHRR